MKNSKRQSVIIIGFGLIILSGIILYFALSMPRISINTDDSGSIYQSTQSSSNFQSEHISDAYSEINQSSVNQNHSDTAVSYPLNLNTCTAEELMTISGIGEKKANDIIEYRDYLGGYTSVEQLKNIKGIGDGIYEKLAPYLTV